MPLSPYARKDIGRCGRGGGGLYRQPLQHSPVRYSPVLSLGAIQEKVNSNVCIGTVQRERHVPAMSATLTMVTQLTQDSG
ncbi:hypothetical protein KIPB_016851 [Kipferlia bialata]|uniref:Uncharacterized protein n=1 Tax=Kipferlia bialata TaxID=797122 RepID=A0A391NXS2_9EUKA|nr:hypothetical protein KIPB_016851 [Kipferlia bialata]|eukprot:g16851.t1